MEGGRCDELRSELEVVKRALQDGSSHLGLKSKSLQRYFLLLREKENLLHSQQVFLGAKVSVTSPLDEESFPTEVVPIAVLSLTAREPPPGPVQVFNKNDVSSVLAHMCDYEAVALESAKALKALAALVYADAAFNTEDSRVLGQLKRLLVLHLAEPQVQLGIMRVIGNAAYDPDVALQRFIDPELQIGILRAMSSTPGNKEVAIKASEAAARLVAAEVCPIGEAPADGSPARTVKQDDVEGCGALIRFFAVAIFSEPNCQRSMFDLVIQLLSNQVVAPETIAARFAESAPPLNNNNNPENVAGAWGWLNLARMLSLECPGAMVSGMVQAGCVRITATLMRSHEANPHVQRKAIEALSSLIGNRPSALQEFSEANGCKLIEVAVKRHIHDAGLVAKGIKALSSAVLWSEDVQSMAGFRYDQAIDLTKSAMSSHGDCTDIQVEGLAALAKYLDNSNCVTEVKDKGGEGLVKAIMLRHSSSEGVQIWGKVVLDALGSDRDWRRRGINRG